MGAVCITGDQTSSLRYDNHSRWPLAYKPPAILSGDVNRGNSLEVIRYDHQIVVANYDGSMQVCLCWQTLSGSCGVARFWSVHMNHYISALCFCVYVFVFVFVCVCVCVSHCLCLCLCLCLCPSLCLCLHLCLFFCHFFALCLYLCLVTVSICVRVCKHLPSVTQCSLIQSLSALWYCLKLMWHSISQRVQ